MSSVTMNSVLNDTSQITVTYRWDIWSDGRTIGRTVVADVGLDGLRAAVGTASQMAAKQQQTGAASDSAAPSSFSSDQATTYMHPNETLPYVYM